MKSVRRFALAACVVLACYEEIRASDESPSDGSRYYDYPRAGVRIGQGWDSTKERATSASCVMVDVAPVEQSGFSTDAREIKSSYSLHRDSSLAIAASYSGGAYSVSASVARKKLHHIDSDRRNFLFEFRSDASSTFAIAPGASSTKFVEQKFDDLISKITNEAIQSRLLDELTRTEQVRGGKISLSPDATELAKDPVAFRKLCGEGFVSGIYRGSLIKVLVTALSNNQLEVDNLAAALSGKGYGAKLNVQTTANTSQAQKSSEFSVSILQEGGVPIAPPKGIDEIDAVFENVEVLLGNPQAYRVRVTPYSDISTGSDALTVAFPPGLKTMTDYYMVLRDLHKSVLSIYRDYVEAKLKQLPPGTATYSKVLIDAYSTTKDGQEYLANLAGEIQLHMSFIERVVRFCSEQPSKCSSLNTAISALQPDIAKKAADMKVAYQTDVVDDQQNDFKALAQNVFKSPNLPAATKGAIAEGLPTNNPIETQSFDDILKAFKMVTNPTPPPAKPTPVESGAAEVRELQPLMDELDTAARVKSAEFSTSVDSYLKIKTEADLDTYFYPKIYDFVARIPVTEESYPLKLKTVKKITSSSWKQGKYRKTETTTTISGALDELQTQIQQTPAGILADVIVQRKLLPWMDYFCSENLSSSLCVDVNTLEEYAAVHIDEELIKEVLTKNASYVTRSRKYDKSKRSGIHF